jgi:hypothetical protein
MLIDAESVTPVLNFPSFKFSSFEIFSSLVLTPQRGLPSH